MKNKMEDVQIKFDALVAEYGAEAVIEAIKKHKPLNDPPTGCDANHPCPTGYYCSGGVCKLNVG